MTEQIKIQRLRKKIEARYGVEMLLALTEFCKQTGCSLQDVAPVDLIKPLEEPPIDENGPLPPEAIREFCEEVTDAFGRGLPLPAQPQRLYGERFKNPTDYKPGMEEQNSVADVRIARGRMVKPTRPRLWYFFRYRVAPANEIKTVSWQTTEWQSATDAFRKTTQGHQIELLGIERRPISFTRVSVPKAPHHLAKEKRFITGEQFQGRYAALRQFVRQKAQRLARGRPDLQDELEQRGLMRLGAVLSDDPEVWKKQVQIAMQSALRAENRSRH